MRRLLFATCLIALPTAVQGGVDPLPYLPANTDVVVTIDAKKVAESELGKKVGANLLKDLVGAYKPAATVLQATGLDPMRDLEFMTVGIDIDKTDPPRPFALFEGKLDAKKIDANIAAYTKEHKDQLIAVTVGGKAAYKFNHNQPAQAMYAAVIDDTKLVVASTESDLTGAFDAAAGTRKPVISKELTWVMGAKPPGPIFVRGWVKGKLKDIKVPNDKLQAAVQGVDWVTVSIAVTKDVAVTAILNTPDEASAQKLSDLLGAVVGLVRLQILAAAEDQPELRPISDLLRATRVAPNGKTVIAYGTVTGASIEKALAPPKKAPEGKKK
ncbi:MAG TPA: hypothetical protein VHR66_08235 [Gemmataceae bacterium]|jgi:hypothetical protein|nr:hypothetical protein [Gemmataceae bacterium]